jgi:predicted nuclease of predicted toxin-antitoxin system
VKILIDECLPHQIRHFLTEHDAQTVKYAGYGGYENGDLLKIAEADFDLFITSDQNLQYQQNLLVRKLAILLLSTNELDEILQNKELILATVNRITPSEFVELEL